ncbi:hypothetical protein H4S02_001371 [Coemansia sp. RSA 2611]|nr:hypothetical protein IWW52_001281 [Coemansia sp. RSA 2704]KAJ2363187.1 hypothetical protein H4S01_004425 [Coemansia sp. RSA 2610]KAJ2391363.1 hypothetical protein H4S02_001371 [Coemansia sp. RSA 2611]KAJ2738386.1 hypothetical protein H4R23_001185 [Coemansia sp. Cherry 401B]
MDEMDPFEARLLFSNMLDNLTGAQPTIDRVSSFAVKNASLADDLYECISEKLDKLQVPPRLNILLVLDGILAAASSRTATAASQAWAPLIKKDIVALVKLVAPETPGGDSNVPQVRKVVAGWRRRSVFDGFILEKLDKLLAKRGGSAGASESGMRHQDILKRIEEDRERHKRHKEDVWIRPANEPSENELDAYWDTTSDFNDADWQEIEAENEEYRRECQLSALETST